MLDEDLKLHLYDVCILLFYGNIWCVISNTGLVLVYSKYQTIFIGVLTTP